MKVALIYNDPDLRADLEPGVTDRYLHNHIIAMEESLKEKNHEIIKLDVKNDVQRLICDIQRNRPDVVVNLCESVFGRAEFEMNVVALLELLKVPYTGASPLSLGICLNKYNHRLFLKDMKIKCPGAVTVRGVQDFNSLEKLKFPVIVKPLYEDGSAGISEGNIFSSPREAAENFERLLGIFSEGLLAEEYIDGREFNCFLVKTKNGVKSFPVSEIKFSFPDKRKYKIISYEAKWSPESIEYKSTIPVCPAELSKTLLKKIQNICVKIFNVMVKKGYARVDLRMDGRNNLYIIDVNPNPDISPDAGAVRQMKAGGWSYTDFVEQILEEGTEYMKNPIFEQVSDEGVQTSESGKDLKIAAPV